MYLLPTVTFIAGGNIYPAVAPSAVYRLRPAALTSGYLVLRRTSRGLYETTSPSPGAGSIPSPATNKPGIGCNINLLVTSGRTTSYYIVAVFRLTECVWIF